MLLFFACLLQTLLNTIPYKELYFDAIHFNYYFNVSDVRPGDVIDIRQVKKSRKKLISFFK